MLYIHFHLEQHPQVRVPNLTHARCSWCQEVTPAEFAAYMQFHYRSLTTRSICLVLFIAVCRARRFGHVQPVKFWTCLLDPFFSRLPATSGNSSKRPTLPRPSVLPCAAPHSIHRRGPFRWRSHKRRCRVRPLDCKKTSGVVWKILKIGRIWGIYSIFHGLSSLLFEYTVPWYSPIFRYAHLGVGWHLPWHLRSKIWGLTGRPHHSYPSMVILGLPKTRTQYPFHDVLVLQRQVYIRSLRKKSPIT